MEIPAEKESNNTIFESFNEITKLLQDPEIVKLQEFYHFIDLPNTKISDAITEGGDINSAQFNRFSKEQLKSMYIKTQLILTSIKKSKIYTPVLINLVL